MLLLLGAMPIFNQPEQACKINISDTTPATLRSVKNVLEVKRV